jgi:hypothetical protein
MWVHGLLQLNWEHRRKHNHNPRSNKKRKQFETLAKRCGNSIKDESTTFLFFLTF